jgi:DNA-binding NtrC family response regulator
MQRPIVVLVVEDEPLVRMCIADHLQDQQFDVYEAGNAEEAMLTLAANADIQVVFTDVDMPGKLDGLELAEAVHDRWPPVRIIVTSGHRDVHLADLPDNSRFFGKPYNANAVETAIREMVRAA